MKKIFIILLGTLLLAFIVIQFFQPEKNYSPTTTDDIFYDIEVPVLVKQNLVNSCYDCHSNQTKYLWYHKIAPVSWMVAKHIKEGKSDLNFSEWAQYSKRKKIGLLGDICEMCEAELMPLKSYTAMHKSAELNAQQIEEICTWTDQATEDFMNK